MDLSIAGSCFGDSITLTKANHSYSFFLRQNIGNPVVFFKFCVNQKNCIKKFKDHHHYWFMTETL